MSNIIKSVYFNVSQEDKRVIDSDSHIKEFVPGIFAWQQKNENIQDEKQMLLTDEAAACDETFQNEMNVIKIDDVLEEEKQKLSEEMERKADKILSDANKQANQIIDNAKEYAEEIKKDAYEEGMSHGIEAGRQEAQSEAEVLRKQFEQECSKRLSEIEQQENSLEKRFADIMINLIGRITGILCDDKRDVIIYLIDNALHNMSKSKNISIHVSKEDIMAANAQKYRFLEKLSTDVSFNIIEDDSLLENQCIIETDNGIIDCGLDTQLNSLIEQIRLLAL